MINVAFGEPRVPRNLDYADRYGHDGVTATETEPNPMPLVAQQPLVLGDTLTTSATARGPYDEEEYRRLHVDGLETAFAMAVTGRRDNADTTLLTGVRMAAAGYVNPYDIIGGAHRPDIPLITTDIQPVP